MKMHYCGGLTIRRGKHIIASLRGWAACASGNAAYKIQNQGNQTVDKTKVTCKRCLNNMRAAGLHVERPQLSGEKQQRFRANQKALGRTELRGIYATEAEQTTLKPEIQKRLKELRNG
jgi:hypothetical protein